MYNMIDKIYDDMYKSRMKYIKFNKKKHKETAINYIIIIS